jgi:hypothetical protein
MLTETDRNEMREHYLVRFRNRSIEGNLEVDQTETKEYQQLDRRIKNLEAELQDSRKELYILNMAFNAASREERVRVAKKALGIRPETEQLLEDVHARAQQSGKLRGDNASYRSRVKNAYHAVRQYVVSGKFGSSCNDRDYHPMYVEQALIGDALAVMYEDTTKKGEPLLDRVRDYRQKVWKEWGDLGQPVDKGDKDPRE